jgi:hypothetical protein
MGKFTGPPVFPHGWLGGGGATGGAHGVMPFPHGWLNSGPVPTGGLSGPMPFPHGWLRSGPASVVTLGVMPLVPIDDSMWY